MDKISLRNLHMNATGDNGNFQLSFLKPQDRGRRIRSPFEWIKPNQRGKRQIVSLSGLIRISRDLRMGSREEERRKLADIINHWNANRLDLFEISQPTEVSPRSRERAQAARASGCPCREIHSPSTRDCYSEETCA
ncbi:Afadin [Anabarilius grahami]|uniref:Afadin n=1 Tax=Anabarilius grahami TaxID=495550 RepID=A0A3N0Z1R3_ANAGA|nr:Afadin [Anabarilius grahami]